MHVTNVSHTLPVHAQVVWPQDVEGVAFPANQFAVQSSSTTTFSSSLSLTPTPYGSTEWTVTDPSPLAYYRVIAYNADNSVNATTAPTQAIDHASGEQFAPCTRSTRCCSAALPHQGHVDGMTLPATLDGMCPAPHITACMHISVMCALSRCCVHNECLLRRIAFMEKPFNSPDTLICISFYGRGSADCDAQSKQQNLAGVFVSPSGSAAPCGLDWGAPCATLSDGIATAATNSISQIWVAPGALSADESRRLALQLCP